LLSKDEAYSQVGDKVVTGSETGLKNRGRFYLYLRQNGLWTREVTGFDPVKERAKLDPFCPVRNVTRDYPPTMLVHGTEDTDVPYELSVNMVEEFKRNKVPHEFITVQGAGHGLSGGDKKLVDAAYAKSLAFIQRSMSEKK
jgi:dipeptidyl aminopeptidase/acylaminoacyl peptidase